MIVLDPKHMTAIDAGQVKGCPPYRVDQGLPHRNFLLQELVSSDHLDIWTKRAKESVNLPQRLACIAS